MAISVVANLVVSSLKSMKWLARDASPTRHGSDIILTKPDGTKYVVEIQAGDRRPRFGELAQVENLANEVRAGEDELVRPIFVTDQEVSDSVAKVAKAVGIDIVEVRGSAEEIAAAVTKHLVGQDD